MLINIFHCDEIKFARDTYLGALVDDIDISKFVIGDKCESWKLRIGA